MSQESFTNGSSSSVRGDKSSLGIELDQPSRRSPPRYSPCVRLMSYFGVIQRNRNYRIYLVSHLCQHTGDWFVRIAALITVGRIAKGSATALGGLVMTKMLPQVFLSPMGGVLADSYDRRKLMIAFDIMSAVVALGYLVAVAEGSLVALYVVSVCRASILSFYEPATRSIVPLIVTDSEDLKMAVTINAIAWSGMLMIGGVVAGQSSAYIGVEACYVIDSVTYLISAFVMWFVKGSYSVAETKHASKKTSCDTVARRTPFSSILQLTRPILSFVAMMTELFYYLCTCDFGLLTLMKSSGSLTWGFADILSVSFAHVEGDESATSRRIGALYSFAGLGCLLGPPIANCFTDLNRPATLQVACIGAFAFMVIGWTGIAHAPNFAFVCFYASVRSFGSAIVWVDSTLILQHLSAKEKLGRVLAFDFAGALGFEALVAFGAGRLQDAGYDKNEIATWAAAIGATFLTLWSFYHVRGGGANRRSNQTLQSDDVETESLKGLSLRGSPAEGSLL